jgi:hypothetical protein
MRINVRVGLAFFLGISLAAAIGCDRDKKKKDEKVREVDEPSGEAPRPAQVIEAPAPIPDVPKGRVATSFPEIVDVPPPRKLAERLGLASKLISAKKWRDRSQGRKILSRVVRGNKRDVQLARFMASHDNPKMVIYSLRLWRGLKEHEDFMPVMVSLLGHSSDQVRSQTLALLTYGVPKERLPAAMPFVRTLLDDKSCNVRRKALAVLASNRQRLALDAKKELLEAFGDPCPAVAALAMKHMANVLRPEEISKPMREQLIKAASESPYYLVRCSALLALGGLGVKGAEKLMAKNLTVAAVPSMTVFYDDGRTPFTFSNHSSMPACAADALAALHDKRPMGKPKERVEHWMQEMAKKNLSPKPPKDMCVSRRNCKKGEEICLDMRCVSYDKAASVYWKYVELSHCEDEKKKKDAKWRNFGSDAARKVGFGLHWAAHHQLRKHLQEKNPEKFKKKFEEIRAKECPE